VITNISKEHEKYLGNKLAEIAKEKGGIIKTNKVAVVAEQEEEVMEVLKKIAEDKKSKFIVAKKIPCNFSVGMKGAHQLQNAVCAIEAVKNLSGVEISEDTIQKGLKKAFIPGRFEIFQRNPTVILDVAHNPAEAAALKETVQEFVQNDKLILVLGMSEGKNHSEFVKLVVPLAKKVYIAQAKFRGVDPKVLEKEVGPFCRNITKINSVKNAYTTALKEANSDDVILVTGSVFVVGEARSKNEVVHTL